MIDGIGAAVLAVVWLVLRIYDAATRASRTIDRIVDDVTGGAR